MDGAHDFRRLFDIFQYQQLKYPKKIALAFFSKKKQVNYSTEKCIRFINEVSAGLMNLGLKKGDKVAIMAKGGHPYWNFLDFGMQQLGIIVVPIHATTTHENLSYTLRQSEVKACFVNSKQLLANIELVLPETPKLIHIFTFEKISNFPSFLELTTHPTEAQMAHFHSMRAAIHEDDLATIIYTSGTTGNPKGVMLSHKNIVSNIKAIIALVPINRSKTAFSFLPLSHIFERMVTYTYIAVGATLFYGSNTEDLAEDLKKIKPHYMASVPRMLEKMYDRFVEKADNSGRLKKPLIFWAIKVGENYKGKKSGNVFYWMKLRLADILVYRSWRRAIGGRVEGIVVGAAALRENLARLYSAAGIEIREGYGMTETSPVISLNHFKSGMFRFGTVGIPIPGLEVKINNPNRIGEGEIIVKGYNVMMGYYKKEAETREVLNEDGWLYTGDIGKWVDKHFLKITDRKKDIFKTTTGKYVAPQLIENHFKNSSFIEQIISIGFKRPFVSALIVPNFVVLKRWCKENNVHWTAPQFMVLNPKVEKKMRLEVSRLNEHLEKHQQVRQFHLLFEEWSTETGELTSTLKLRREKVMQKHEKEIEKLYEEMKF